MFKNKVLLFIVSLSLINILNLLSFQLKLIPLSLWTASNFLFLSILIFCATKLINEVYFDSLYLKVLFSCFVVYEGVLIIRGLPLDYNSIKNDLILSDFVFWPFVIPIFIFFNKSEQNIAQLLRVFYFLGIFFLIGSVIMPSLILNRASAEAFIHPFAFGSSFLLMNAYFLSKKKIFICFLVTMVATLSLTYLARRNGILTYGGFFLASVYLYLRSLPGKNKIQIIPVIVGIVFGLFIFSGKLPKSLTERLNDRLTEDSRSGVFDALFASLKKDMVFGKGLDGSYYCPIEETIEDDGAVYAEVVYRNIIENGYLQQLLEGGYVYIILFLLILLPAAFLGIFQSKNQFTRACGIIILLWLIDMAVYGLPRLVLQYIFVWISVGICYTKAFRFKNNEDIQTIFREAGLSEKNLLFT